MRGNTKSPGRTTTVLLVGVALVATGCAGEKIGAEAKSVREQIERARKSGAYRCAPKELAFAEAYVEFSENDLKQGDFLRARKEMEVAKRSISIALRDSKDCAPVRVLVKAADPVVIKREDRDNDGVPDVDDRCPDDPGPPENQGCPLIQDTDGDGILDAQDKCPVDPEDLDGFEDEDGCPDLDNDQDGLTDPADKCPDVPGPPENEGCPVLDRDGDGINDDVDQCPDQPETYNNYQDQDGCPDEKPYQLIVINRQAQRIEIKQKIHFDTAKATINPDSFALLDEVADALATNAQMNIRIEGHTDSRGSNAYNQRLSDARANSVRDYLLDKGLDTERMKAKGYGESRPIASNKTYRGRERNRRVEFHIIGE